MHAIVVVHMGLSPGGVQNQKSIPQQVKSNNVHPLKVKNHGPITLVNSACWYILP